MIQFDDADERDVRRRQLAKRLLQHQARTNLIYRFAGYTRYRLTSYETDWEFRKMCVPEAHLRPRSLPFFVPPTKRRPAAPRFFRSYLARFRRRDV